MTPLGTCSSVSLTKLVRAKNMWFCWTLGVALASSPAEDFLCPCGFPLAAPASLSTQRGNITVCSDRLRSEFSPLTHTNGTRNSFCHFPPASHLCRLMKQIYKMFWSSWNIFNSRWFIFALTCTAWGKITPYSSHHSELENPQGQQILSFNEERDLQMPPLSSCLFVKNQREPKPDHN